ncbi:MAG: hypothetical protein OXG95_01845 [Chloroflexi bacterium]|nr:hypothetical protein [Chloroflexota bacterium]
MADTTELEALIARLANDRTLQQRREASTRAGAIDPTLSALGWNVHDLNEVDPEFKDSGGGWADYCLRGRGRDLVLIEAKRASADLSQHEEQLQRYAFGLSVDLAVLTNGLEWWLYLPTKGGRSFGRRRFARVDFRTQDPEEAAAALDRFLNRDACLSGTALREAEAEFERRERDETVREALPEAWSRVLADRRFRDILAQVVEDVSGHRPTSETLAEFLRGVPGGQGVTLAGWRKSQSPPHAGVPPGPDPPATTALPHAAGRRGGTSPADLVVALLGEVGAPLHYREIERRLRETGSFEAGGRDPADTLLSRFFNDPRLRRVGRGTYGLAAAGNAAQEPTAGEIPNGHQTAPPPEDPQTFTGRTPVAFILDGTRYGVTTWKGILHGVCNVLAADSGSRFGDSVAPLRGKKRIYFSRQAADLAEPRRIANSDFFVETHFSANDCIRRTREVLRAVRGNDDGFRVELAE